MVEVIHSIATMFGKLGANLALGRWIVPRVRRLQTVCEPYFPATFFAGGFAFDVATASRIDHWVTLAQQGVFLSLIGGLLALEAHFHLRERPLPDWLEQHRSYAESIVHFLFGGLLSAYTIFYFKSASSLCAAAFVLLLMAVFVLNERPTLRRRGLPVKFLLFSLCTASYFTYLVPILWGSIGALPFTVSICASLLVMSLLLKAIAWKADLSLRAAHHLLAPALSVQLLFSGLYFVGALPPVPLSIQYLGIFHEVERRGDAYLLHHENPSWRFWHRGDQVFHARTGDRIYGFARIFSPTDFADEVFVRWLHREANGDWTTSDRIPVGITGGRSEGFRGFTYKRNYQPGDWQLRVETKDGRELGRIRFEVEEDQREGARRFQTIES
jgi:hypothetical protein